MAAAGGPTSAWGLGCSGPRHGLTHHRHKGSVGPGERVAGLGSAVFKLKLVRSPSPATSVRPTCHTKVMAS